MSAAHHAPWGEILLRSCRNPIKRRAKERFTSRDIAIFERLTLEQEPAGEVAKTLGLSSEAIRQIRHRVLRHMREIREELENDS